MLGTLKIVAMIASVVWMMIALFLSLLIAVFSEYPFFQSPLNWVLIASPSIPLAVFYWLDRIDE
ncbi:hypothetical protein [Sphingomonas sp. Leaf357]|uniref:hypothetical protein n=1 Tax=Sphingomonas sp. Leaf357 TaxID=1736350 RepID=UPI000A97971E|nr:hypothetical protein [Sphingomonas sp. Leaf357]